MGKVLAHLSSRFLPAWFLYDHIYHKFKIPVQLYIVNQHIHTFLKVTVQVLL